MQFFVGDVHVWKRYSGSKQTVWCAYYWTRSILWCSSGGGVLGCSSTSLLVAVLCIARMICAAPVRHTLLSNTTSSHLYGDTDLLSIPACKTDSLYDLECAIFSTYLCSICICFAYLIKVLYINKTNTCVWEIKCVLLSCMLYTIFISNLLRVNESEPTQTVIYRKNILY